MAWRNAFGRLAPLLEVAQAYAEIEVRGAVPRLDFGELGVGAARRLRSRAFRTECGRGRNRGPARASPSSMALLSRRAALSSLPSRCRETALESVLLARF